jgi:hypothetical protein
MNAVSRYQPAKAHPSRLASPTIHGELKRYPDRIWLSGPRGLQEEIIAVDSAASNSQPASPQPVSR